MLRPSTTQFFRPLNHSHLANVCLAFVFLAFVCLCSGCLNSTAPPDPIPAHKSFDLVSKVLDEKRVITAWLPPGYADSEDAFPVLYMLDGGVKEDFPHIANTVADLIDRGEIAPLILVGIENTERRRDLTGPSSVASDGEIAPLDDGAAKFRQFLHDELFVEVSKRFRINDQRAIVGESVAGLFIVETLLLNPDMFNIYVAMDPSLHWNDHHLVRTVSDRLKELPDTKIKFWFAGSDAVDIYVHTDALSKVLEQQAPTNLDWKYSPQPKEQHNTIFRATKDAAFKWALWPSKTVN